VWGYLTYSASGSSLVMLMSLESVMLEVFTLMHNLNSREIKSVVFIPPYQFQMCIWHLPFVLSAPITVRSLAGAREMLIAFNSEILAPFVSKLHSWFAGTEWGRDSLLWRHNVQKKWLTKKRREHSTNSDLTTAEAMLMWIYIPTPPYAFMAYCLNKETEIFTT
jgi:hypothetical protein